MLSIAHIDNARTNGPIFTVYVNHMSVRSGSLHMPRILDAFLQAVIAACYFPEGVASCEDRINDVITQIEFYVQEVLSA